MISLLEYINKVKTSNYSAEPLRSDMTPGDVIRVLYALGYKYNQDAEDELKKNYVFTPEFRKRMMSGKWYFYIENLPQSYLFLYAGHGDNIVKIVFNNKNDYKMDYYVRLDKKGHVINSYKPDESRLQILDNHIRKV